MTSRERVRATINHQPCDRAPNGLGGCETAGLHVLTYDRLQDILKTAKTPPRIDTFMVNAVFEQDVIAAMEGDIILMSSPRMCKADLRSEGWENQWKNQQIWNKTFSVPNADRFTNNADGSVVWHTCGEVVCPADAYFFDSMVGTDLLAEFDEPNVDDFNPSHELPEQMLRNLENTAKKLYNETDLSLCLGETIMDLQVQPGGMIGSMILMKQEPEIMKAFLQKSVDCALSQLKQLDQAVGKYVDILSIAHDFGDNRGVTIGRPLWLEIYKPYYKQLFEGWKNITNMKSNLHSCGAVSDILGDLIDCGIQIYNPVQISADGMSPKGLKDRFGKDLVFWGGGYDTQLFKVEDDYQTVYDKVCSVVNDMKQGGGYIFAGVHNLPSEISHEHLKAMLDAWNASRWFYSE